MQTLRRTIENCNFCIFWGLVSLHSSYMRQDPSESMWIEKDILPAVAGTGKGRVFITKNWWSQIKTAGSAIYANRLGG